MSNLVMDWPCGVADHQLNVYSCKPCIITCVLNKMYDV